MIPTVPSRVDLDVVLERPDLVARSERALDGLIQAAAEAAGETVALQAAAQVARERRAALLRRAGEMVAGMPPRGGGAE